MAPLITIMGPIGSGKTDQAQRLAADLGWLTFSTGQLVREDGDVAAMAAAQIGKLAPTAYVQELVLAKIKSIPKTTGIILDGSPRMLAEVERMERDLPKLGRKLNLAIFLQIKESVVEQRLAKRGRSDDQPEIIRVRWDEYQRDTVPVVAYLRSKEAVCEVEADASLDEVAISIKKCLEQRGLI